MKKDVIMIRHGRTDANAKKIYIGQKLDVPLSEEGREAAKAFALELSKLVGENIYLVSSPMKRAYETAELLFPGKEIILKDAIKEMDLGDFEGKNYEQLNGNPDYQSWIDSNGAGPIPNGEDRDDFIRRSYKAFEEIIAESGDKLPVIICHGGTIMAVMSVLTGKDYFDFMIGNMEGFELSLNIENERIVDISYSSINA